MAVHEFVSDVMSRGLLVVSSDMSALEVAQLMRDEGVEEVVIASDGVVWGMVSDHDLGVRLVAAGLDPASTPVSLVGASIVYTVAPDQEIRDVRTLMRTHGIRQVPVVDHGDIVGVVTLADLAFEDDGGTVLAIVGATDQTTLSSGTVAGIPVGGNGS